MVTLKKFWSETCGPCNALAPTIEQIKNQFGSVMFQDININNDFETARSYGVRSIPLVVIEKDGVEVERILGNQPASTYINKLNAVA
jgi:thioredoxin 1